MATEILKTFGNLQYELEEAKNSLKGVDENIKRLIGRDPSEFPARNVQKRPNDDKGRPKGPARIRSFTHENEEPPIKRKSHISVFKRLSDKVPDDEPPVPHRGLISKVIVTPKEIPSREQALEAQNKDEKFKARNKRMFGALLGTLQKFQQEETKLKQREQKRAELEKKIEEHEIKEKEEVRKERQELFFNRKKKQAEIKVIELKILRMKEYASWEQSQKPRMNYILTKAKPYIHYLPRKMTDQSKKLLEESNKNLQETLDEKKKQIADEMQHIEEKMKKNFEHKFGNKEEKEEVIENSSRRRHHDNDDQDQDDQFDDHNESTTIKNEDSNQNTENVKEEQNGENTAEKNVEMQIDNVENTEIGSVIVKESFDANNGSEVNNLSVNDVDNKSKDQDFQSEYNNSEYETNYITVQMGNYGPQTSD